MGDMQATDQAPAPAAPAAPPAPAAPFPSAISIVGADGKTLRLPVPQSEVEVRALVIRRNEVADQLSSVSDRRSRLSEEIRAAPEGASRTGLEGRLGVLDQRILQLEADLASTGQLLALTPPELVQHTQQMSPSSGGGDDFEEGLLAGGFFVALLVPVMYFWLRRRWRKRGVSQPVPEIQGESARRLERLEAGMESIAIEIERVSEGQRFVTRLLSESPSPIGVGRRIAEPEPAANARSES